MREQVLFNHIKLDTHPQIHGFLNMHYNNQFGKKWKIRVSEVYNNKQGHSFLAWSFIYFFLITLVCPQMIRNSELGEFIWKGFSQWTEITNKFDYKHLLFLTAFTIFQKVKIIAHIHSGKLWNIKLLSVCVCVKYAPHYIYLQ